MRTPLKYLALIGLTVTCATAASASEYCVICSVPEARYRCMTNDGRDGAGTDQRSWLQCVQQLAKSGGHESCSIDRTTVAPCLGSIKNVDIDPGDLGTRAVGGPPIEQQPHDSPAPAPDVAGEPVAKPPPATAAEPAAAEPANPGFMEKSKQNIEKAGSAIGDAAQKSWDCMSSLFKKC